METIKNRGLSLETKVATTLLVIIMFCFAGALAADILTIPQTGYVQPSGVEMFWDSSLTQVITSMDWGILAPNRTYTSNVTYAHNISTENITLYFETPNINPYISQTWNYTQAIIVPNGVIPIVWSITVDPNAPVNTPVNWDLLVYANQTT